MRTLYHEHIETQSKTELKLSATEFFLFQPNPEISVKSLKRGENVTYLASSSQKVVSSDSHGFEGSGGTRNGS